MLDDDRTGASPVPAAGKEEGDPAPGIAFRIQRGALASAGPDG
ncbi:MAG TPA: hypothetical protein VFV97_13135 [Rhodanobacteraceae bacterium]|nr:hypothetical protein [Rhodanobacteraceae bacterium]